MKQLFWLWCATVAIVHSHRHEHRDDASLFMTNYTIFINTTSPADLSGIVWPGDSDNYKNRSVDVQYTQNAVVKTLNMIQTAVRMIATLIRISADTGAGVVGGLVKTVGGLFNLLANLLKQLSAGLQQSSNDSILQTTVHRFGKGLNTTALVLKGIGEAFLFGGEVAESLTSGLGESLQYSFGALEKIPAGVQRIVLYLLHQYQQRRAASAAAAAEGGDGDEPSAEEVGELIRQQNRLYHQQQQRQRQGSPSSFHDSVPADTLEGDVNARHIHRAPGASKLRPVHPKDNLSAKRTAAGVGAGDIERRFRDTAAGDGGGEDPDDLAGFGRASARARRMFDSSISWVRDRAAAALNCMNGPWQNDGANEVPSTGAYLLLGLLLVSAANLAEYSSVRRRIAVLLVCIAVVWACIVSVEHSQRLRLVQRTSVKTLHSYLAHQATGHSNSSHIPQCGMDRLGIPCNKNKSSTVYESAAWLNTALSAMWNVDPGGRGGLRAYYSDMCGQMLAEELARAPGSSAATVRLKQFDLGTSAPLVKGVRASSNRDQVCIDALIAAASRSHGRAGGGPSKEHSVNGSTAGAADYWERIMAFLARGGGRLESQQSGSAGASEHAHVFSSACDSVAVDVDFVFASSGMAIELSLRHGDSRSVLPDLTVSLSEVLLEGQLRVDTRLAPDYPFLGAANVSFLARPGLDFTVSSFGGSVELSAIPVAFAWMNASLQFVLSQYTAPLHTTIDLRHIMCPSCDMTPVLSVREAALQGWHRAQESAAAALRALKRLVAREAHLVEKSWRRVAKACRSARALAEKIADRLGRLGQKQPAEGLRRLVGRLGGELDKLLSGTGGAGGSNQTCGSASNHRRQSADNKNNAPTADTPSINDDSRNSSGKLRPVAAIRKLFRKLASSVRDAARDVTLEDLLHF